MALPVIIIILLVPGIYGLGYFYRRSHARNDISLAVTDSYRSKFPLLPDDLGV